MIRQKAKAIIYEDIFSDRYARLIEPKEIDGQRDFFIPPHITQGALTGDCVEIQIRTASRIPDNFKIVPTLAKSGKPYAKYAAVNRILEYSNNYCIGHYVAEGDGFFVPDDRSIPRLPIFKTRRQNAVDGEKVLATISRKKYAQEYKAAIEKTYGNSRLFEANYNAQLDAVYGDLGFGGDEVDAINVFETPSQNKARKDLRSKSAVTVEGGDSSPGIAYSVERDGDGYTLYVHYADLDEYVKRSSALDDVLKKRMRNLRMPHKSVGMLPDKLFKIVSFTAGEDKLALSLVMHFTKDGSCTGVECAESIINVTVNGKYDELDALIKNSDMSSTMRIRDKYAPVMDMLKLMYGFGAVLMRKLDNSGAFVGTDLIPAFVFDGWQPVDLVETDLCDIKLLRRCIYVATGIAVADHIGKNGFPLIYQENPEPGAEVMREIGEYWDGELSKENLCSVLSTLYQTVTVSAAQKTQYIKMFRAVSKTSASSVPARHHMYKVNAFALMPSPCTNYGGLCMLRIFKAYLAGDKDLAKEIAEDGVWSFKQHNAYHLAIEERLYDLAMAAYVSYRHYPAEAVVSGISREELAITLANGGVGWIKSRMLEGAVYDSDTNTVFYRGTKLKFGSYITVVFEELNYNEGRAYFAPHR
ncbi:MAG TPA: RNB domain-containing ribonuclease [Bacillota bacterium]|nr:RNB domain-containing ribonuclease [Bacillota bacterium]